MKVPSEAGLTEAEHQVTEFAKELLTEAGRIAKRADAEHASATHVSRAANNLYATGASRAGQALTTIGGLFAGAGSSALTTVVMEDSISAQGVVFSAIVTAGGIVAISWGLARR